MKKFCYTKLTLFFFLGCASLLAQANKQKTPQLSQITSGKGVHFTENKGQIFDQNGQVRNDILFYGNDRNLAVHLKKTGLSYTISQPQNEDLKILGGVDEHPQRRTEQYRVDISWVNGNSDVKVYARDTLKGYKNFYTVPQGSDPILYVKSYANLLYKSIYPKIDLYFFQGEDGGLEYDFILHPGADPSQIKLEVTGANVKFNSNNEMEIQTPLGSIIEGPLQAFQAENKVVSEWRIDSNIVGVDIGNFDPTLPLLIDPPVRLWGTYLGGPGGEWIHDCKVDSEGNLYVSGLSQASSGIATMGAHKTTNADSDVFLAKFDSTGILIWGTYFGGSGFEGGGHLALDQSDSSLYITGATRSQNGISTVGAHQSNNGGGSPWSLLDAFLVKFDFNGIRQWGTFYGSTWADVGTDCTVDDNGYVYLSGYTESAGGIATPGAHQATYQGLKDGFLVKFDSNGNRIWGTYYGGTSNDEGLSCAANGVGEIYLAGSTGSTSGIATPNTHQTLRGVNSYDTFLAKFNASGQRLWGTYYGGSGHEWEPTCAVDHTGNLYLAGNTSSTAGIASSGAHQPVAGNAFIARFNETGSRLWGTYFGDNNNELINHCTLDKFGNVFLSGSTQGATGIATSGAYQTSFGGLRDCFLAYFNPQGVQIWGTYYGDIGTDEAYASVINNLGDIYLAGHTTSGNGFVTSGAHQLNYIGGSISGMGDAFVSKFNYCTNSFSNISLTSCDSLRSPSGRHLWQASGVYEDTISNIAGCDSILTINLTISSSPIDTITTEACFQLTSPSGNILWDTSGIFADTLLDSKGCDSVVVTSLTIHNLDTSVVQNGSSLTSNMNNGSYQWLDCNNNFASIAGAINKTFIPGTNGYYAVMVSDSNCTDTSGCTLVDNVNLSSFQISPQISLYPNPSSGKFTVDLGVVVGDVRLRISDIAGRELLRTDNLNGRKFQVQFRESNGVYLLEISTGDFVSYKKVVIR